MTESVFLIERYDSMTRWRVHSETEKDVWYLVDVMAYHKTGRCVCPHFTMRLEPMARLVTEEMDCLRCKHIRAARNKLLNALLDEIAEPEHQRIENE